LGLSLSLSFGSGLKGGCNLSFSFGFAGASFCGGLGLKVLDFCRGTCTCNTLLLTKSLFILAASHKINISAGVLSFRLRLFAFCCGVRKSFPVLRFGTPVMGSMPVNGSSGTVLLLISQPNEREGGGVHRYRHHLISPLNCATACPALLRWLSIA
jgi:hypothetical protein